MDGLVSLCFGLRDGRSIRQHGAHGRWGRSGRSNWGESCCRIRRVSKLAGAKAVWLACTQVTQVTWNNCQMMLASCQNIWEDWGLRKDGQAYKVKSVRKEPDEI